MFQIPYESNTFGLKFTHKVEIPTPIVNYAPVRPFNGKHVYVCEHMPQSSQSSEQYVEFQAQYSSQGQHEYSSSRQYGNYRSSSRSAESSEDISSGEFRPVEVDPILQQPSKRVLHMSWQTKHTRIERNVQSQITLLMDEQYRCQLNIQAMEEHCEGKVYTNIVADYNKIMYPKKEEPQGELVAKYEIGYGTQSFKQYYASMKILTGDQNTKIEIPAEPLVSCKLRQFFNIYNVQVNGQEVQIPSQETQESQSILSLFGMQSSYSQHQQEQQEIQYNCATTPVQEVRPYAYKYTIQVNYEQLPQHVQEIAQYYYQYVKYMSQEYVADVPKEYRQQTPSHGTCNVYVRFLNSMERLHLLVDTLQQETIFYYPARLPTYLKRALTLDSDLILLNEKQQGQLRDSGSDNKGKL